MHRNILSILAVMLLTPVGILLFWLLAMWGAHQLAGDRIAATDRPIVAHQQRTTAPVVVPMSTRSLYVAYCAQCHGETGDGQGTRELDRPARSFKDGGFSFGNTTEALFRTISNGIGGTPMPGYADTLSADERRRLADYVRELGPEVIEVDASATIMRVTDRPRVVRGHLPSLGEGLPEHPRGIIMAAPDGMSFQYAVGDTVQLLAVRQGDFVERTDWTDRGGSPLKPLGRVIDLLEPGRPLLHMPEGGTARHLSGTAVESDRAVIRYRIDRPGLDPRVTVSEWGSAATSSLGSGYRRVLSIESTDDIALRLQLPDRFPVVDRLEDGDRTWVIRSLDGQRHLAQCIPSGSYDDDAGMTIMLLEDNPTTIIELTTLFLPEWNDALADALKEAE